MTGHDRWRGRCRHLSGAGWRCTRPRWHRGAHVPFPDWLTAQLGKQ